jgi:hypothetical protein
MLHKISFADSGFESSKHQYFAFDLKVIPRIRTRALDGPARYDATKDRSSCSGIVHGRATVHNFQLTDIRGNRQHLRECAALLRLRGHSDILSLLSGIHPSLHTAKSTRGSKRNVVKLVVVVKGGENLVLLPTTF